MSPWLQVAATRALLTVHVQPGAKTTEIVGLHGDALKIRLAAPPVDGKANASLIAFIADRLGTAKSAITVKSGQTSRRKTIAIEAPPADIEQRLGG